MLQSEAGYIDARPQRLDRRKPLATHGRTIHSGQTRTSADVLRHDRLTLESGLTRSPRDVAEVPNPEVDRPCNRAVAWRWATTFRSRPCGRRRALPTSPIRPVEFSFEARDLQFWQCRWQWSVTFAPASSPPRAHSRTAALRSCSAGRLQCIETCCREK